MAGAGFPAEVSRAAMAGIDVARGGDDPAELGAVCIARMLIGLASWFEDGSLLKHGSGINRRFCAKSRSRAQASVATYR